MEKLIERLSAMEANWSIQEPGHRLIDEIADARKSSQQQHKRRKIASLGVSRFFYHQHNNIADDSSWLGQLPTVAFYISFVFVLRPPPVTLSQLFSGFIGAVLSKASLTLTKTAAAIKRREVKGVDMSFFSNEEEVVSSDDQSSVKFRDLQNRSQDDHSCSSGCDHQHGIEREEEGSENGDDDDGGGDCPYDDSQDSSSATASNGESLNDFGEDEQGVDNALSVASSNDSSSVDFTVWGGCADSADEVGRSSVTSKHRGIVAW
jgi:hypothetical protein